MDAATERVFLGVAHALFMNRLHVLRLTEIVRLEIKKDPEDGTLQLPPELDEELRQQAVNYVLACFPEDLSMQINQAKKDWVRPA